MKQQLDCEDVRCEVDYDKALRQINFTDEVYRAHQQSQERDAGERKR
jgi:hypothetical protein